MSNYRAIAFNPQTKKIEEAAWLDNCFGMHVYGVKFDDTAEVFHAHQCGLDAAAAELTRLQQSNAALVERMRQIKARATAIPGDDLKELQRQMAHISALAQSAERT